MARTSSNRPHVRSSLVALTAIAKAKNVSDQVVKDVLSELEHRTTAGARRLKRELLNARPHLASTATVQNSKPSAKGAARQSSGRRHDSHLPTSIVYEENAVAYEFLRNTFTEEGEILARWGMTPLLPEDMMKKIFEMWRVHLKKNKDSMFRTVQQLESDQEKLLKISKQRNMKAGGK